MTFKTNLYSWCILSKIYNESLLNIRRYSLRKPYNVLFFGSDNIALNSLKKINELRTSNVISKLHLVTANSTKFGSIVEKYAISNDIKIIQWPLSSLQRNEYDIGLIVAFGHMIKKDLLEKFPLGMVNIHPSLLPRWRGAAPIIHTLLHADQETGVTLMKIKPDKFDVGEIISQMRISIPNDIKLPELTEQLSTYGADLLVDCLRSLPESLTKAQPQSTVGVTYAKKITKCISIIQWSEMEATSIYNLYRAVYGLYNLSTQFRDKQIKLFDVFLDNREEPQTDSIKPVGTIEYCEARSAIKVLCKDKRYIYFKSLRIVGKRKITAVDFYNGYIKNNQSDYINNIFY